MEKPIHNQGEKLVISFSGCSKNDTGNDKKDNASDRIDTNKWVYRTGNYSGQTKQLVSQLSYKF